MEVSLKNKKGKKKIKFDGLGGPFKKTKRIGNMERCWP
jgi:hypothetical protein